MPGPLAFVLPTPDTILEGLVRTNLRDLAQTVLPRVQRYDFTLDYREYLELLRLAGGHMTLWRKCFAR